MIDAVQAVLLFVIILLTILLLVLGIQVFFILRSFRETVARMNNILSNTEDITESVSEPATMVSNIITSSKAIGTIAKVLSSKGKSAEE